MSISLIGKDGAAIATVTTNPVPVQLTTTGMNQVSYDQNDFTLDSFERLRVSEPTCVFEYSYSAFLPASATTIWETGTTGTASTDVLTTNLYGFNIGMPTNTVSGRWYQTYNHIRYTPGTSVLFRHTFVPGTVTANQRDRVGMFTDQGTFPSAAGDGFFYENDAGTIYMVRRYMTQGAGSEERVAQASWNLNRCQGAGDVADASRNIFTLDVTKAQHFVVEYQHLGVGTIRFGWETGANGVVWCHEMHSVNTIAEGWCRTGSLPVRIESYNYGVASTHNFTNICTAVYHEGNTMDLRGWRYFSGDSGSTAKTGGTAVGLYPLLSIRAAGTNDLTKRARIMPVSVSINVITAGTVGVTPIKVSLLMLGTPNTGATYAVTIAGSAVVVDNAATASTAVTGTAVWTVSIPNVIGTYTFDLTFMRDNTNLIGTAASGTQAITGAGNLILAAGPMVAAFTAAAALSATINWKEMV